MKYKITGGILIVVNAYWIFNNLKLLHLYNFSDIIFSYMIPDWILVLSSLIGIFGVIIGINLFKCQIKMVKGITISFLLILARIVIELPSTM
jgi:hypothetical protein